MKPTKIPTPYPLNYIEGLVKAFLYVAALTLLAVCLWGCHTTHQAPKDQFPVGLSIIIIDSCEYLYSYSSRSADNYCHKGNCKNPIHQCKQIVIQHDTLYLPLKK